MGRESRFSVRKIQLQSQILASILVEQKIGVLAVFCTPLLERKIQNMPKKAKKSQLHMFHVKHFCANLGIPV